jgi:hypothetical protein
MKGKESIGYQLNYVDHSTRPSIAYRCFDHDTWKMALAIDLHIQCSHSHYADK